MPNVSCARCGKIFYRNPSKIRGDTYCSIPCHRKGKYTFIYKGSIRIAHEGHQLLTVRFSGKDNLKEQLKRYEEYERTVSFD